MRAIAEGELPLLLGHVHRDDLLHTARHRRQKAGDPHAAEADDRDGVPLFRGRGIEQGAAAGQHGTSQDRSDGGRHVRADGHHGLPIHDRVGRESGDAQVMEHLVTVAVESDPAAQEDAGVVRLRAGSAGQATVGLARIAFAASRQERHDDPLADLHVVDTLTELLDDPGGLVAEQHGDGPNAMTVHHGEIRMAHP